jgi:hypothetical protein
MLALLGVLYTMPLWNRSRTREKPPETVQSIDEPTVPVANRPEPAPPAPPPPPKKTPGQFIEDEIHANRHEEARQLALKYLEGGTEEEKNAAEKHLPSLNMRVFKELLAGGDHAKINAAIDRAWNDKDAALPERETLEVLVASWETAIANHDGDAAEAFLRKAAEFAVQDTHSISYWGYRNGALEDALCKKYPLANLMERGKESLDSGDPVLALAYLSAAAKLNASPDTKVPVAGGPKEWLERQNRLCESFVGVGALAEAGKLRWLPPDENLENKVEILLQHATRHIHDAKRISASAGKDKEDSVVPPEVKYAVAFRAWDQLFNLYLGKLDRICARQEPHRILSYCDDILYDGSGRWIAFLEDTCGTEKALKQIPPRIADAMSGEKNSATEKMQEFKEHIRLKRCSPEFKGKENFLKARQKAKFDSGKERFRNGKFDDAFGFFRDIFRDAPSSTEAVAARGMILESINSAGKSNDFDRIHRLASFLIGETKSSAFPPEIREQLARTLSAAADFFQSKSKMKRAFMLSLKSNVLGDSPEGNAARDEAMKIGFEAVRELPFKESPKSEIRMPSLLEGCSVDAIRNLTEFHLLAFYSGPETFFVRLNPYSKGSLALRNGDYEIAVVVTSDTVTPYRSKTTYQTEYNPLKYVIVRSNEKNTRWNDDSDFFSGKFTPLRTPKGFENTSFDPASGMFHGKPANPPAAP